MYMYILQIQTKITKRILMRTQIEELSRGKTSEVRKILGKSLADL